MFSQDGRFIRMQVEPLKQFHNENMVAMLEYVTQLTDLAKDIEQSVLPNDPEYESNRQQIEEIDSIVRDYLDMIRLTKGHVDTLQQLTDSTSVVRTIVF